MNEQTPVSREETCIHLRFDPARGACQKPGQEATVGAPAGKLPEAVRRGYVFVGWFSPDGDRITPDTVITFTESTTLTARWQKEAGMGKHSFFRQRRAAVLLACVAVLLAVAAVWVAVRLVGTYTYTDPADGQAYTVRRMWSDADEGYVYQLADESGKVLPTVNYSTAANDYVFYETAAGTWVQVDAESGDAETYAVVDVEGSEQVGFGDRVLMYPSMAQSDVYSISVTNEYGTFCVQRDASGNMRFTGAEDVIAYPNSELLASLCSACGYTLSALRVENPVKDANGTFAEEYGLDGSRQFTITRANIDASGTYSAGTERYTVYIGDALVTGGGYYAQLEGRDKVYIFSIAGKSSAFYHTIDEVLLVPVEDLVNAAYSYPMDSNSYYDVVDVGVFRFPDAYHDGDEDAAELLIAFSFVPSWKRQGTLDSTVSYQADGGMLSGFALSEDNVSAMVQALYATSPVRCVKLLPTDADLARYGLDRYVSAVRYGMWVDLSDYLDYTAFADDRMTEVYRTSYTDTESVTQSDGSSVTLDTVVVSRMFDATADADGETLTYRVTTSKYHFFYGGAWLTDADALKKELASGAYTKGSGGYEYRYDTATRLYYYRVEGSVYYAAVDQQSYASYNSTSSKVERLLYNTLFISAENADGNVYVYNELCGQIVEVSTEDFDFLAWDAVTWVNTQFFSVPLAYVTDLEATAGDYRVTMTFDNSASDQSEGFDSADIVMHAEDTEGNETDACARFVFYSTQTSGGKDVLTVWQITETDFTIYNVETGNPMRYNGGDYTAENLYGVSAKCFSGTLVCTDGTKVTVTPDTVTLKKDGETTVYPRYTVKNFRQFYVALMYASIEGQAERSELDSALLDAIDGVTDTPATFTLRIRVEDTAAASGYAENNVYTYVFRFWQYSKGKMYVTAEVFDRDGNLTTTPDAQATYHFYVKASFVEKLAADLKRVMRGELVTADSKN